MSGQAPAGQSPHSVPGASPPPHNNKIVGSSRRFYYYAPLTVDAYIVASTVPLFAAWFGGLRKFGDKAKNSNKLKKGARDAYLLAMTELGGLPEFMNTETKRNFGDRKAPSGMELLPEATEGARENVRVR